MKLLQTSKYNKGNYYVLSARLVNVNYKLGSMTKDLASGGYSKKISWTRLEESSASSLQASRLQEAGCTELWNRDALLVNPLENNLSP